MNSAFKLAETTKESLKVKRIQLTSYSLKIVGSLKKKQKSYRVLEDRYEEFLNS